MRRGASLVVSTLLKRPQYFFKVHLHAPLVRPDELREAHSLKVHEPCAKVFWSCRADSESDPSSMIDIHHEAGRRAVVAPLEDAVERRVAILNCFAAACLVSIRRGAIAQGFG